jgi:hypothetical protein
LREGLTAGAAKKALSLDSRFVPPCELMDWEYLDSFVEVDLTGQCNLRFAFTVRVSSLPYRLSIHPLHRTIASRAATIMGATSFCSTAGVNVVHRIV